MRQIRGDRLWRELGFMSFNEYAKSDGCPYSSNYAYKMSAASTDPLLSAVEITDQDLAAPGDMADLVLSSDAGVVTDPLLAELAGVAKQLDETEVKPEHRHPGPVTDLHGNELHGDMAKLFINASHHFAGLYAAIHEMRATLKNLVSDSSGARFAVHNRSAVLMQHLHDIEGIVNDSRPYSVCISCSGNRRQCIACGGVGFINEQQYIDATTTKRRRG